MALPLAFALAGGLAKRGPENQQPEREQSPLTSVATRTANSPAADTWKLSNLDGSINLIINPDGTWIFAGGFKDHRKNQYFDVSLAIKSSKGAVYLFHYEGDAANGITFSRQGESSVLKEEFKTLHIHRWVGSYALLSDATGRRAHYEAEQRKLEEIRKAEAEGRKAHRQQIVIAKIRAERIAAASELKWQAQQSGAHGAGVASSMSRALKGVGSSAVFLVFL